MTELNKDMKFVPTAKLFLERPLLAFTFTGGLCVVVGTYLVLNAPETHYALLSALLTCACLALVFLGAKARIIALERQYISKTLDAIVDIYWHWDLTSGEFAYHGHLRDMLGYQQDSEADDGFWKEIIHPVDRPIQKYKMLQHLQNEAIPYYCEYRLMDNEGQYQWFAGRGKVVSRDEQGKALLMVGSLEHIQARKDLENSLIHAHKMEALGQLTGGIAHDFNNMLGTILGYAELGLDTNSESKLKNYMEQIHIAGSRARNVVRQLLDFSRSGRAEIQAVLLQDELTESMQMLRSTLPSSIEMQKDYPEVPCYTRLDPNQLQRVLLNLCINARDAMENKGILTLRIQHALESDDTCASCQIKFTGPYHVISVEDNGAGIPPNIHGRLFEPFFTTKAFGKGSGMGLSVVHGIVHDYGGHICVKSEPGKTVFSLYLPMVNPAQVKPEPATTSLSH